MIREMIAAFKRYWAPSLNKIEALDLRLTREMRVPITNDAVYAVARETRGITLQPGESIEFAVARSPRHIPWSRRRKELEAEARQKRRHLESFREQA